MGLGESSSTAQRSDSLAQAFMQCFLSSVGGHHSDRRAEDATFERLKRTLDGQAVNGGPKLKKGD
ncbi:hypothetical protein GY26_19390, partial [Gammaproteobacteria bacterium MFB021]